MRRMKPVLILLAVALLIPLTACGQNQPAAPAPSNAPPAQTASPSGNPAQPADTAPENLKIPVFNIGGFDTALDPTYTFTTYTVNLFISTNGYLIRLNPDHEW